MFRKILKCLIITLIAIIIILLVTNLIVITTTKDKVISNEQAKDLTDNDCILILGAGIYGNNPSPMLEDRLLQGLSLYENNVSPKILVSGDHTTENHDETNTMKDYLVGHKVPSQDVFMDHAGISTYDSLYRTKQIFKAGKIIIVTQEYHLYRALYIADKLNIEAYGVASNPRTYLNQEKREIREILARTKDFFKSIIKPTSTYLGEEIPITSNGDITNDY
ncbi:MAG: YdcF family protein [Bacilli bacterium]|nr:YdcF family protein [Bacilli bacterium]